MSEGRTIEIDLHKDLVAFFRSELTRLGYVGAYEPGDRDLPRIYFDVCKRLVSPGQRKIHKGKGFSCPNEFRNALVTIEGKLQIGESIIPYLSTRITGLHYNDAMLNDWGIHHLHLGDKVESNGFISRTGPLLYCRFERDYVYFIDILPHGNWNTQTLLTRMHESWPEILERYRIRGVKGSRLSDQEIKKLRRKNCNYCLELADGTTYAPPGGGTVGSGSNVLSVMETIQFRKLIQMEQNQIVENIDEIADKALSKGLNLPDPARFELKLLEGQFYAVERDSKIAVCLKSFSEKVTDENADG